MSRHTPIPLEKLKTMRPPIPNIGVKHREKMSRLEILALFVTKRVGTLGFFLIIFFWSAIWLGWNIFAPTEFRFDPFPAFVLWLFISNLIQILLMPLIMVGQNLQGKYAEARAEVDFEVNLKAEREIEAILQHLENQNELLSKIDQRLESK